MIFIEGNVFENVVCTMLTILSQLQYVCRIKTDHFNLVSFAIFQEIAILDFRTSDCFQNEAMYDNKLTVVAGPFGNT